MARGKEQQHRGQELYQSDQTQIEGALGNVIYLPADGDGLHLGGHDGEQARQLIAAEVGIPESNATAGAQVVQLSHCSLLCHRSGPGAEIRGGDWRVRSWWAESPLGREKIRGLDAGLRDSSTSAIEMTGLALFAAQISLVLHKRGENRPSRDWSLPFILDHGA